MLSAEDAFCWSIESARLIKQETISTQLVDSFVFIDTVEKIRVLAEVIETTTHGEDLMGITTLLDEEWYTGTRHLTGSR